MFDKNRYPVYSIPTEQPQINIWSLVNTHAMLLIYLATHMERVYDRLARTNK
jgi:hypothetical protein